MKAVDSIRPGILEKLAPAFPVLFLFGLVFSHLGQGHVAVDALRYAGIAAHMNESRDWWNLYDPFTQSAYANKPPLLLWLVATSIKVFGFSTLSAKLPSALCACLAIWLLWRTAITLFSERIAVFSVLLFTMNRSFAKDIIDLTFEGLVTLGGVSVLAGVLELFCRKPDSHKGAWLLGLGLALLVQSKPPYMLLVLGPIAAACIFRLTPFRPRVTLAVFLGVAVPFGIAVLWFLFQNAPYVQQAADNQLLEPFRQHHSRPENVRRWVSSFVLGFLPLSLIIPFALTAELRRYREKMMQAGQELFLLVWSASILPIIVVVDSRPRYILIPMLALALLAARYLDQLLPPFSISRLRGLAVALALCLFPLFALLPKNLHRKDPILEMIEQYPDILRSPIQVCVSDPKTLTTPHARQFAIAAKLYLTEVPSIRSVESLAEDPPAAGTIVAANTLCAHQLTERGFPASVLAESRRAVLLITGKASQPRSD